MSIEEYLADNPKHEKLDVFKAMGIMFCKHCGKESDVSRNFYENLIKKEGQ